MNVSDIIETYEKLRSINETARFEKLSPDTVIRTLISHGIYPCGRAEEINNMINSGMSVDQIAERLNITRKSVFKYIPYSKGSYTFTPKSSNALKIQKHRQKIKG